MNALELLFTFSEHNIYNIVDSLNYMAAHYLRNILEDPKSVKSSIKHKMLTITTSADKNLRVFRGMKMPECHLKHILTFYNTVHLSGKLKSF